MKNENLLKGKHEKQDPTTETECFKICFPSWSVSLHLNWSLVHPNNWQIQTFLREGSLNMSRVGVSRGSTSSPDGSPLGLLLSLLWLHLFEHSHNVLLLLRHHRNSSWFAVLADIPLSGKQKKSRDGRERSARRREEETEYETVDLTSASTSPATLMYLENNA